MSWVARKIAGLDNENQELVIYEYFKHKQQQEEIKKFWEEYEDEYYAGGS